MGIVHNRKIFLLMGLSFVVRAFLASIVELGDDEVYYHTYALFPDWSHFDHPPMLGWIIQLFSLNLLVDNELFIRLGAIVIGTVNTYIIYRIGEEMESARTGWYAALLYTASVYCSVISGLFIMPDAPLSLFWLLSMLVMVRLFGLGTKQIDKKGVLWLGVWIGLGLLSKYTALFLWGGAFLFVLCFQRGWFKSPYSYLALLITLCCFIPVIVWNFESNFISFTFHSSRVSLSESGLKPLSFLKELGGGIGYNNPINWGIFAVSLVALYKRGRHGIAQKEWFLLALSLPIIVLFLVISLFRDTLPHWSAPGFYGLIVLGAMHLDRRHQPEAKLPKVIRWAMGFLLIILVGAVAGIKTGCLPTQTPPERRDMGAWDFTLSMYGMAQAGEKFATVHSQWVKDGVMEDDAPLIAHKWFPAAHFDYYIAHPTGLRLLTIGSLEDTHKYEWITALRGGHRMGESAYGIISTRFYQDVKTLYGQYYKEITPLDTIDIERMGKTVYQLYIYKLSDLQHIPPITIPHRGE